MKDWILNRIKILRSENIIDLYGVLWDRSLQDLQEPSKVVNYANGEKNIERSPLKQTAQRLKKEQINE
jgi:hypothetical protein|tara:strand:+ start:203 stop:406 length:204 start_codon:yes stop_codon:yes gene_type:complete